MVHDQLIHIHRLKQIHSMELQKAKQKELDSVDDRSSPSPTTGKDPPPIVEGEKVEPSKDEDSKTIETTDANSSKNYDKKPNRRSRSTKRRLSWRNLLNPSYKSRSDSFFKIFCDTIPKCERLIADYSCALHREILIQGRLYISVNYVAFYSNLFTWITKLVIHLRDVVEIRKTNTAKFIPNAIQLVCSNGEKHVFASFVARDKSHSMISRLWRNNLSSDLSTEDIRELVHMNYGKDLGMSDNEELSINSPDRLEPERSPPNLEKRHGRQKTKRYSLSIDRGQLRDSNNNSSEPSANNNQELDRFRNHWLSSPVLPFRNSLSDSSPSIGRHFLDESMGDDAEKSTCSFSSQRFRRRCHLDLGMRAGRVDQNEVVNEVVVKLNELRDFNMQPQRDERDEEASFCNSSPVILDTPNSIKAADSYSSGSITRLSFEDPQSSMHDNSNDRSINNNFQRQVSLDESNSDFVDHNPLEDAPNEVDEIDVDVEEDQLLSETSEMDHPSSRVLLDDVASGAKDIEQMKECTECLEHSGKVLADKILDIDVDELFRLLFIDRNFIQAYGESNGVSNYAASSWQSANLEELPEPQVSCSRKLNYSMSINHVWAKQVQVEEFQEICRLQRGSLYQLRTRSVNSGIPYGETFSMGLSYLLSGRLEEDGRNKSRLFVQSVVNFDKDKASWRLNLVKPVIERQSLSGVQGFISGLISCLEGHIRGLRCITDDLLVDEEKPEASCVPPAPSVDGNPIHWSPNRIQEKSRLKERKLRSMYKYYLREAPNEVFGATRDRLVAATSTDSLSSSFLGPSCPQSGASSSDLGHQDDELIEDRVSMLVNRERVCLDQVSVEPGASVSGEQFERVSEAVYKERRLEHPASFEQEVELQAFSLKSDRFEILLIIVLFGLLLCSHMLIMKRLDTLEARWTAFEDTWREQKRQM